MPSLFDSFTVQNSVFVSDLLAILFEHSEMFNILSFIAVWHVSPLFARLPNNKTHLHVGWMLSNDAILQREIDWLTLREKTKEIPIPIDRSYLCRKSWMIIECFLTCLEGFTHFAIDHQQVKFPTKTKINHTSVLARKMLF